MILAVTQPSVLPKEFEVSHANKYHTRTEFVTDRRIRTKDHVDFEV